MRVVVQTAALGLSIIGIATAGEAGAAMQSVREYTEIPAEDLGTALRDLATEKQFQVLYRADAVRNVRTSGATGTFTAGEALERLLQGTGLTYRYVDARTVMIAPAGTFKSDAVTGNTTSRAVDASSGNRTEKAQRSFSGSFRMAQVDPGQAPGAAALEQARRPAESSAGELQEVVVTAQKREQLLRNVPISIGVIRGAELDSSTALGLSDALSRVPGVSVAYGAQGGATQITVRGVTAGNANFQGASAVGYYLDSAPFGFVKAAIAPDPDAYDLARVEVLRGPQGTLYGASSLNGVVRVLTRDADLNAFEFKTRESGSTTDEGGGNYRGDMAVNVPIVDGVVAARGVVSYQNLSGWIDTPNARHTNGAVERAERLKVNAHPTEALSLTFSAWDSRNDYGATNMANDQNFRDTTGREPISTDYDVYSVKAVYDFRAFSLSSMTSYVTYGNWGILDLAEGGVPVSLRTQFSSRMMSQEFDLNSQLQGAWRWSAGAIYRDDRDLRYQVLPVILPAPINVTDRSRSAAVYGELTRLFWDGRLELTGGLRYFEDHVGVRENTPEDGIPGSIHNGSGIFVRMTPRAVLTWHATDSLTAYTSYSEGFRSGSPQAPEVLAVQPDFPSLKADRLDNYEVGVKNSLFAGRLEWEAAAYYIEWRDVQQALGIPVGGNVDLIALINAATASGPGMDFSVLARPADGFDFGFNLNWNRLQFNQSIYSSGALYAAAGDRLSYSPEYTIGAHADYAFGLGIAGLRGRLSLSGNYTSKQVFRYDAGGGSIVREPGDDITIARAGFAVDAGTNWSALLYGDNLFNEYGAYVRRIYGFGEDWSSRPRPRTLGVQFEYHFQ